jgi:penicillin-binding protein 1B
VPTAKLATEVGLSNIVDLARRLGITSELTALPSMALGAIEAHPWEVAQVYQTFSNWGVRQKLHLLTEVNTAQGETVWRFAPEPTAVAPTRAVAQLVSMMEQAFSIGTAQSARALGFHHAAAGKTGTTSDQKDTWFAGFTPSLLALAWVGYDDNTPLPFTGASAALPLWTQFMTKALAGRAGAPTDFTYPSSIELHEVAPSDLAPNIPEDTVFPNNYVRLVK